MRTLLLNVCVGVVLAATLVTGCGSDEPDADSQSAQRESPSAGSSSPAAVLDTISYDGKLRTLPKGPAPTQQLQIGIFCAAPEGRDCNLAGLSVGNQQVLDLVRTDSDSFTVDLKGTKTTCDSRGASAVTGTIELSGRAMVMTLKTPEERLSCPDGELTYSASTYEFNGEYVDGGLPGFTVDGSDGRPSPTATESNAGG